MRNIFVFTVCLFTMVACNSKRTFVDDMNESTVADAMSAITDTCVFNKQNRNLVYMLDPACSVCIANYMIFLESLGYSSCNYDSLYTIVLNSNYLMNVEYYLNRDSICRPETERYIIDNEGTLTDYYYSISNNNSILLFDGGRLIFSTSVQAYRYEQGIGLVREKN